MRVFIITSIILALNSLFYPNLIAQTTAELNALKMGIPHVYTSTYIDSVVTYNSEYDWLFSHLFVFYKKYISSQDASSCSFTPSCSEYAIMAVKKQGVLVGLLNFWDRFSRCNGMSPENYNIDHKLRLLIDPVRDWHYVEK
jgi:uncharacterized protein